MISFIKSSIKNSREMLMILFMPTCNGSEVEFQSFFIVKVCKPH